MYRREAVSGWGGRSCDSASLRGNGIGEISSWQNVATSQLQQGRRWRSLQLINAAWAKKMGRGTRIEKLIQWRVWGEKQELCEREEADIWGKQPQKGGRERKRTVRGWYSMTGLGHQRMKGEGKKWQGGLWNNLWNLWQKGIYRPAKKLLLLLILQAQVFQVCVVSPPNSAWKLMLQATFSLFLLT